MHKTNYIQLRTSFGVSMSNVFFPEFKMAGDCAVLPKKCQITKHPNVTSGSHAGFSPLFHLNLYIQSQILPVHPPTQPPLQTPSYPHQVPLPYRQCTQSSQSMPFVPARHSRMLWNKGCVVISGTCFHSDLAYQGYLFTVRKRLA